MDSICTKLPKNEKIFCFDIFYNLVCCCHKRVIKTSGCSNFVYRTFKSLEDQWDYLLRTGASLLLFVSRYKLFSYSCVLRICKRVLVYFNILMSPHTRHTTDNRHRGFSLLSQYLCCSLLCACYVCFELQQLLTKTFSLANFETSLSIFRLSCLQSQSLGGGIFILIICFERVLK